MQSKRPYSRQGGHVQDCLYGGATSPYGMLSPKPVMAPIEGAAFAGGAVSTDSPSSCRYRRISVVGTAVVQRATDRGRHPVAGCARLHAGT